MSTAAVRRRERRAPRDARRRASVPPPPDRCLVYLGSAWLVAPPALSNGVGAAYVALPLPQDPALVNLQANAQFVWFGPTSPAPCPPLGYSASNALEITIQP